MNVCTCFICASSILLQFLHSVPPILHPRSRLVLCCARVFIAFSSSVPQSVREIQTLSRKQNTASTVHVTTFWRQFVVVVAVVVVVVVRIPRQTCPTCERARKGECVFTVDCCCVATTLYPSCVFGACDAFTSRMRMLTVARAPCALHACLHNTAVQ